MEIDEITNNLIEAGLREFSKFIKEQVQTAMERKTIAWDNLHFVCDTTGTTTVFYNDKEIIKWSYPVIEKEDGKFTYKWTMYKAKG